MSCLLRTHRKLFCCQSKPTNLTVLSGHLEFHGIVDLLRVRHIHATKTLHGPATCLTRGEARNMPGSPPVSPLAHSLRLSVPIRSPDRGIRVEGAHDASPEGARGRGQPGPLWCSPRWEQEERGAPWRPRSATALRIPGSLPSVLTLLLPKPRR